tara:strand:+ start:22 stop:204 length:183 start_codon:yes stop_codon:yes gene_type:complete
MLFHFYIFIILFSVSDFVEPGSSGSHPTSSYLSSVSDYFVKSQEWSVISKQGAWSSVFAQ